MVILNISAFLLMNFSAHTKVPDRYERWWVTAVTPCPRMPGPLVTSTRVGRPVQVGAYQVGAYIYTKEMTKKFIHFLK